MIRNTEKYEVESYFSMRSCTGYRICTISVLAIGYEETRIRTLDYVGVVKG
jgi:hypothetical protein